MIGMRNCGWSSGRRVVRWEADKNLGDDKNIRWFITWLLCLVSRHSRWWISAVRTRLRRASSQGFLSFFFLRVCEGFFKLPRLFLSDELPLNEAFFLNLSQWRKIRMRPFFGEKSEWKAAWLFIGHRKQRQKQRPAKSWPKLDPSREKACYMT